MGKSIGIVDDPLVKRMKRRRKTFKKRAREKSIEKTEDAGTSKKRKVDEDDTRKRKSDEVEEEVNLKKLKIDIPEVETTFEYKSEHLISEDEPKDLFRLDDAKCSIEHSFKTDWFFHFCDEISLEGLDGITIQGLWARLKKLSEYPVLLEGKEPLLWNFLKHIEELRYYILEKPRGDLNIVDRNSLLCPETGIVLESIEPVEDNYPFLMVNTDGVRGSCSTYYTRVDETSTVKLLSLEDAMRTYGNRLVIVASQRMRERSIMNGSNYTDITDNEYGMLERVGRSRRFGEQSQGTTSISLIVKDPRSLFHVRKLLENKKLLKKQFFMVRNPLNNQNKTGKLLHLPRFFHVHKSKSLILMEQAVELLRQKPEFYLEFKKFKKYFPRSTGMHKMVKQPEFLKYIRTNVFFPYRFLYPDAPVSEWKYRKKKIERQIRVFQLVDPTVNISACWNTRINETNSDDETSDDEAPGQKMINNDFLKEVFLVIFNQGKAGIRLQDLIKRIEFDYYTLRTALKKLMAKNVIDSIKTDHGKQRHILYFARCFHSGVQLSLPEPKKGKLPEDVLQKILRQQGSITTQNIKKESELKFNGEKSFRNFSLLLPFECKAFKQKPSPQTEIREPETNNELYLKNEISINLRNDDIPIKIFTSTPKNRPKIDITYSDQIDITTWFIDYDLLLKLILLKTLISGEEPNILKCLEKSNEPTDNTTDKLAALETNRKNLTSRPTQKYGKDYLLGFNPIVVYEETNKDDVDIIVTQSTPPKSYVTDYETYTSHDKNLTTLHRYRINVILDTINKSRLVEINKLQRTLVETNENEGVDQGRGKIDKNTLHRLLIRLSTEGYLKIFKILVAKDSKLKVGWTITHSIVDINNPILKSMVDQLVIKMFSVEVVQAPSVFTGISTLKLISPTTTEYTYKLSRSFAGSIGFQPKFARLRLFHELLFYLVYDYSGRELTEGEQEEIRVLCDAGPDDYMPKAYSEIRDWRMFIPPLPRSEQWVDGWAFLSDVLLSTPICIWVKIFRISVEAPELKTLLEHPVKKFFLMKDLPSDLRYVAMYRRRFIYSAVEMVERLCFMGLTQMGPQSAQVKDQIFLYLNKRASLLDTTTSCPSYHKVSPKTYQKIEFYFERKADIEEYWGQMWTICMNTPLGQRMVLQGKFVTVDNVTYKPSLQKTLKSKTQDQAIKDDTGEIPGDRLGAGGLDSTLWAHLKRNWSVLTKSVQNRGPTTKALTYEDANVSQINPLPLKYKQNVIPVLPKARSESSAKPVTIKRKKGNIIRKKYQFKHRKDANVMDAKDRMIIKKVGRTRGICSSKNEDRILLLCKAACHFLSIGLSSDVISGSVIRDILHAMCSESQTKTTIMCLRRITRLWKTDPMMRLVKENVRKLIHLPEFATYFSPILRDIDRGHHVRSNPYTAPELTTIYFHLVSLLDQNYEKVEEILGGHRVTVDYFSPQNIQNFSSVIVPMVQSKSSYTNPRSVEAISTETIKSVLVTFLNGAKNEPTMSYQLFKVCSRYQDGMLTTATLSLQRSQVISRNKLTKPEKDTPRSMPFQLSVWYKTMQKSTYPQQAIRHTYKSYSTGKPNSGIPAAICRNEIFSIWPHVRLHFYIPENAHALILNEKQRFEIGKQLAHLYQNYLEIKKEKIEASKPIQNATSSDNPETEVAPSIIGQKRHCERVRSNIIRCLMSLPCYCNQTIRENILLFMEVKDLKGINHYLKLFIESLISIALNLLSTKPDHQAFLQACTTRYERIITIDNETVVLERRVFKMAHLIREFLRSHYVVNLNDCFDDACSAEHDDKYEEIIRSWLNKSQIDVRKTKLKTEEKQKIQVDDSNVWRTFFKLGKPKQTTTKVWETPINSQSEPIERIPEIDEIIEGMNQPQQSDLLPSFDQLASLMLNEKLTKSEKKEKLVEKLKRYFVTKYPYLESFEVEDFENCLLVNELLDPEKRETFVDEVYEKCLIKQPSAWDLADKIMEVHGNLIDCELANDILYFITDKGVVGATADELKNEFDRKISTLSLIHILDLLIDRSLILRTGVAEFVFVRSDCNDLWLIETCHLTANEKNMLTEHAKDGTRKLEKRIEDVEFIDPFKIFPVPWVRLDGSFNSALLIKWLTMILSYCLDFPNCSMMNLMDKFYLIKPVDLFFLLEVLQDLNCLTIVKSVKHVTDLYSIMEEENVVSATYLDNFSDISIQVHSFSMTCMGFYLDREFNEMS